MRVDLDVEHGSLEGLPRFQSAAVHAGRLRRLTWLSGGLGLLLLLLALAIDLFAPESLWMAVLSSNAAASFVLAAGLQSAQGIALWRARALLGTVSDIASSPAPEPETVASNGYDRLVNRISNLGQSMLAQIGAATLWLAGWAVLALISLELTWNLALPATPLSQMGSVAGGLAVLLAFGLLVLERQLNAEQNEWPEAAQLSQLARVVIAALLVGALCLFFASAERIWPARLAVLIGLLPGVVAAELLLRAILSLFSPRNPRLEPRVTASSFVAGLLRWPPQPLLALQHELHNRFGIDLRQVWAFTYMRRAFFPVLLVVVTLGWALSGVHEIPIDRKSTRLNSSHWE